MIQSRWDMNSESCFVTILLLFTEGRLRNDRIALGINVFGHQVANIVVASRKSLLAG